MNRFRGYFRSKAMVQLYTERKCLNLVDSKISISQYGMNQLKLPDCTFKKP